MSKLSKLSPEFVEIFDDLLKNHITLSQCVKIDLLASEKLKSVYAVFKATEMVNFYSENDVIIVFNEELLNVLDDEKAQRFYIEEALAYIHYDLDSDSIKLVKPDINASFSGLVKKYGIEEFIRFNELINLFNQQKEDKLKEEKRQKKEKTKEDKEKTKSNG